MNIKNDNRLAISINGGFVFTVWSPGGNCFGNFEDTFVFKTFDELRDFMEEKMLQELNKEPLKAA